MATKEKEGDKFSEEKEHYNSLINLFKYCVGFVGVLSTFLGYITFKDGQEMRESQREARQEISNNLKEMREEMQQERDRMEQKAAQSRTELAENEKEVKGDVSNLIESATRDINATRSDALNQIAGVKDEATTTARLEANKSIVDVFKARNLEPFIEKVAKENLDPKIQQIVDNQIKKVNQVFDRQAAEQILLTNNVRGFGNGGLATGYSISVLDSLSRFASSISVKKQALKHITDLRTGKQPYFQDSRNLDDYKKLTTDSLAKYVFKEFFAKDIRTLLNDKPALVDLVYKSIKSDEVDNSSLKLVFILFNKLTNHNIGYYDYTELSKAYTDYKKQTN